MREGHEIGVHRQQHQLDGHQQHNEVFAVKENANDRQGEQHSAQRQIVSQGDIHDLGSSLAACKTACCTGSIFTMRSLSAGLALICSAGFCILLSLR